MEEKFPIRNRIEIVISILKGGRSDRMKSYRRLTMMVTLYKMYATILQRLEVKRRKLLPDTVNRKRENGESYEGVKEKRNRRAVG